MDSTFLIANEGGIFTVASDLGVTPLEQYYAIGSGGEYAIGVLYTLYSRTDDIESIATDAVQAAIAMNLQCGGQTRNSSVNNMTMPQTITVLALDVDGVLTDGKLHIADNGNVTKIFNAHDGLGISLWQKCGFHIVLISGRNENSVTIRANELGIEHVFSK